MLENTFLQRWNELSSAKQVLLDKRLYQQSSAGTALETIAEPDETIAQAQVRYREGNRPEIKPVSREGYRRKRSELFEASN